MKTLTMNVVKEVNQMEALIFVDGLLNSEPCTFLLDTGAATSAIKLDEVTERFEVISLTESSGTFSTSEYEVVKIEQIQIGFMHASMFMIHRNRKRSGFPHHVLGLDIMGNFALIFNFHERKIDLIEEPTHNAILTNDMVAGSKNHFCLEVLFDGIKGMALWDTGASITVVDQAFIEKNPSLFTYESKTMGTDSGGISQETSVFRMSRSVIGGCHFESINIASVDLSHINSKSSIPIDMILGYPTISQYKWHIDFLHRKWGIDLAEQ